ncbi:DUF1492 domain-containing protein [Megasphaera sp.]|uniref:DUF1492 domain-containing protein n=1 Tax=Megasphaera sp. TaxID=2023260 RepID=UPI00307A0C38
MDIVRANIVDAKQFLLLIREQHYELEELKYERYLEENGLCLKVSNPERPCVSAGGPNDLSRIPVHIEQFVKKIAHEEAALYRIREMGKDFISLLPDARSRAILKYYYVDFLTWEQVSMRIHLSPSRMYNNHKQALEQLNSLIRAAWMRKFIEILKDRSK